MAVKNIQIRNEENGKFESFILPIKHGGTGVTNSAALLKQIKGLGFKGLLSNTGVTPNTDTALFWKNQGPGIWWCDITGLLWNQPTQYGYLINIDNGTNDCNQVFFGNGSLGFWYRQGYNGSTMEKQWSSGPNWLKPGALDAYPVGAIYISWNSASPAGLFGGTWTQINGYFLRAANDVSTGGNNTMTADNTNLRGHSHTINSHTHAIDITSGSHAHNISGWGGWTGTSGDVNAGAAASWGITGVTWDKSKWPMIGADTKDASGAGRQGRVTATAASVRIQGTSGGSGQLTSNQNSANDKTNNNMPLYQNVYVWRRTA